MKVYQHLQQIALNISQFWIKYSIIVTYPESEVTQYEPLLLYRAPKNTVGHDRRDTRYLIRTINRLYTEEKITTYYVGDAQGFDAPTSETVISTELFHLIYALWSLFPTPDRMHREVPMKKTAISGSKMVPTT